MNKRIPDLYGGQHPARSIQNLFKNSLQEVGIFKVVGIYSLRNVMLLQVRKGKRFRFMQELLGQYD